MVKLQGPLYSLFASGRIRLPRTVALSGSTGEEPEHGWVYERRRNSQGVFPIARKMVYTTVRHTPAQQLLRSKFALAVAGWQLLTEEEKTYWRRLKRPERMSGYNRYLSAFLFGNL